MKTRYFQTAALMLALMLVACPAAWAALSYDYPGSPVVITDNDATGVAFNFSLSDPMTSITSIEVNLHLSAGYNGDLYAYLTHDAGGFAVLLNRTGVGTTTGGSSASGYADTGFNVTFSSLATANVHFYGNHDPNFNGSGELTGNWLPDARGIDPESTPGDFEAAGTADFSTFTGVDPNGNWTLLIADVSPGSVSTLEDFSLTLTAVPEPVLPALCGFAGVLCATGGWRAWRAFRARRCS